MSSIYQLIRSKLDPPQAGQNQYIPQYRLESKAHDLNSEAGLAMKIADPLWMLGRQWQFGEFLGEDNATPVSVDIKFRKRQLNQLGEWNSQELPVDFNKFPLEYCVENIPQNELNLRQTVQAGQQLERLLKIYDADTAPDIILQLRSEFPLAKARFPQMDAASLSFFKMMEGRVLDGQLIFTWLRANDNPQTYQKAADAYRSWYVKQYNLIEAAATNYYQAPQLRHRFNSSYQQGAERVQLDAPDYQSGELDWDTFSGLSRLNLSDLATPAEQFRGLQPVSLSFSAMPDKRLYTFEDNKVDLGEMEIDPSDLLRMMLINFSFLSSNDWFTIPFEMKLGEMAWIEEIVVKDAFGIKTVIKHGKTSEGLQIGPTLDDNPLKVWDVFKIRSGNLASYDPIHDGFFLPPTVHKRQESNPVEEVLFLRDEYANMVWGLEKTVSNQLGEPRNGFDQHRELNGPFLPQDTPDVIIRDEQGNELPRFQLSSSVPFNWIPYLPVHLENQQQEIELWRARIVDPTENKVIEPLSQLVKSDLEKVREEAIPRSGTRVQLTRQRIRWTDGKTYTWLGRKTSVGRGEGSSGLKFDHLTDTQAQADD